MQKMMIRLGPDITIHLEGNDPQELIRQAAFWGSIPKECALCKSALVFFHKTPGDNPYYGFRCLGNESHAINFSETKKEKQMYFDNRKPWQKWGGGSLDGENFDDARPRTDTPGRRDDHASPDPSIRSNLGHPNDPNSPRGRLVSQVRDLIGRCDAAGIRHGMNVGSLGGMPGQGLKNTALMLEQQLSKQTHQA